MSHALLSPSASHRWIACPPSARLTEFLADTESSFAAEGTLAHSVAEEKLNHRLGQAPSAPVCDDAEMDEYTSDYADFVMEQTDGLKDPIVYVEQHVDCSRYVPECFGTCDALIVSDGVLHIIDLKSGRGVKVDAEENDQLRIYALGAIKCFLDAFNNLLARKDEIAKNYDECLAAITDDSAYKARLAEVEDLGTGLATRMRDNLTRESHMIDDCGEDSPLQKERDEITAKYEALQKEQHELTSKIALCAAKKVQVRGFLQLLRKQKTALVDFDPLVWQAAVLYMVINEDCTVKFVFRDGTELPWVIDPGVKSRKKRKVAKPCPQD